MIWIHIKEQAEITVDSCLEKIKSEGDVWFMIFGLGSIDQVVELLRAMPVNLKVKLSSMLFDRREVGDVVRILRAIPPNLDVDMGNIALDRRSTADIIAILQATPKHMTGFSQPIKEYLINNVSIFNTAKTTNQVYAQAILADSKPLSEITATTKYSLFERDSVSMSQNNFYYSSKNQPSSIESGIPVILSSSHSVCPLVLGRNESGTEAFAWHISYQDLEGGLREPKLRIRGVTPIFNEAMTYIAVDMTQTYKSVFPDNIKPNKYYRVPGDVHRRGLTICDKNADYSASYYPNSDTLLLWGQHVAGWICVWQMRNAVLGDGSQKWQILVLGSSENPMECWNAFLSKHYQEHMLEAPLSEDALMPLFAQYHQELKQINYPGLAAYYEMERQQENAENIRSYINDLVAKSQSAAKVNKAGLTIKEIWYMIRNGLYVESLAANNDDFNAALRLVSLHLPVNRSLLEGLSEEQKIKVAIAEVNSPDGLRNKAEIYQAANAFMPSYEQVSSSNKILRLEEDEEEKRYISKYNCSIS